MRRVYLAGDIVFRPDAEEIFARLRSICREAGAPLNFFATSGCRRLMSASRI
jgi:nucleoside 2-deoxyribosyltransferase